MTRQMDNIRIMHWATFDGYAGVPASGPSGKADIYYDNTAKYLKVMVDTGSPSVLPTLAHPVFTGVLGTPVISAAVQVANARVVSIQLVDSNGVNIAAATVVKVWISDAAAGAQTGTTPGGAVAISGGSGAIVDTLTAKISFMIASSTAGLIKLSIDDNGSGATWFINVAGADGKVTSTSFVWT